MAREFTCIGCGRPIVSFGYDSGKDLCGACIIIPGWHKDPELRKRLDPNYEEEKENGQS